MRHRYETASLIDKWLHFWPIALLAAGFLYLSADAGATDVKPEKKIATWVHVVTCNYNHVVIIFTDASLIELNINAMDKTAQAALTKAVGPAQGRNVRVPCGTHI